MIWILAIGLAAAAFAVGCYVGLRAGGAGARIRQLESELVAAQGRFDEYREHVEKHFKETAHLFHDLAHKHAALYTHLAEGARELLGHPVALEGGLGDPLIALGPDPGPGQPERPDREEP